MSGFDDKYKVHSLFIIPRFSRSAPVFYNLSDSVIDILSYILTSFSLSGWYQSAYIYIQIYTDWCHLLGGRRAEIQCYTYYNFLFIIIIIIIMFMVEWICWMEQVLKCNVMPTIIFFFFLRLNGSVNGLKPGIYYYYLLLLNPIEYLRFINCYGKTDREMDALAQWHMIGHRLFVSELIGNVVYLHASMFEMPM